METVQNVKWNKFEIYGNIYKTKLHKRELKR